MGVVQIQDDAFRRVLRFLGLRSRLEHEYESTVRPVLVVGDLGQPTSVIETAGGVLAGGLLTLFTVPQGESWRLLAMTGTLTQAGGAVAGTFRLILADWSTTQFIPVPFYTDQNLTLGEQTAQSFTLNSANRYSVWHRSKIILGPGQRVRINTATADGTLTAGAAIIIVQKLGGVLTEVD